MKLENYAFAMGMVVGIVIGFIAGIAYAVQTAIAENFTYNMTKDEIDEFRLTELCFNLQKTNMAITVLDEFCRQTYGDIDSEYGEAMK